MPIAPASNQVFVPKQPAASQKQQSFSKWATKIDPQILYQQQEQMNDLLKRHVTLIGADKRKEQFTMRGHLDNLESIINTMLTELSYHDRQVQILSAEKETSGAVLHMNVCQMNNAVLNDEYKNR